MIDFTDLPKKNKAYAGANGNKLSVIYNCEQYMLKFPPVPKTNKEMSYTNSCVSEYIGSHIFNMVGIPAQETLLGTYKIKGKEKIVVACKDFTSIGITLQDFASLKNQVIDSDSNGYGTVLDDLIYTMENQTALDVIELKTHFWDMFIIDALIGNFDRHNGNWGFLYNAQTDELKLAPVFDCGSCLYPQADDEMIKKILGNQSELEARIYVFPQSAIHDDGKKVNYFDYISSLKNPDCNKALKRMAKRIDIDKMCSMINDIECLTDLQKDFYCKMLAERKTRIIDYPLQQLKKKERADRNKAAR